MTVIHVNSGVPQGSVRDPTMWNILNDALLCPHRAGKIVVNYKMVGIQKITTGISRLIQNTKKDCSHSF